jgi:hypothetical protein
MQRDNILFGQEQENEKAAAAEKQEWKRPSRRRFRPKDSGRVSGFRGNKESRPTVLDVLVHAGPGLDWTGLD